MPLARVDRPSSRLGALVLGVLIFGSYAYFYEGGGWNPNTRFDLVRAIVEHQTVRIDRYHENTGDKAHVGRHYYTDKAPGASLTAVPPVAMARLAMRATGADVESKPVIVALSYVATLAAAALPAAIAAVCVFWISMLLGAGETAAAIGCLVCGLATPLWPYATILYGHALAGGCLIAALLGALLVAEAGPRSRTTVGIVTGLSAGWAVVTEYPAIIPGGIILLFALFRCWQRDRTSVVANTLSMGLGLAGAAAALIIYNWSAFGAPFHIGYTSEEGYEAMRTGIFGVNWPKWSVARELLFGEYRGLLPLAPVLALAPAGYWLLLRDRASRPTAAIGASVAIYYFLLTAGYAYWSGGWSYGSRHLGPALPFLCLGIPPLWDRGRGWLRVLLLALALVGAGESLIAVSTTPQPPADYQRPMRDLLWPMFRSGDYPISWQSVLDLRPPPGPMSQLARDGVPREAWNIGLLLGLTGHASLIPLLVFWLTCAAAFVLGRPAPGPQKR